MLSSPIPIPILLFLLLTFVSSAAIAEETPATPPSPGITVYELLLKFGFPPGILPDNVRSFSLAADGEFEVELEAPCYLQFDYQVYYAQHISGVVKIGVIEDLKGIQVQRFFLWFDVDSIKVDLPPSNYIYFQVGWITKKLEVEQFETVQTCTNSACELLEATRKVLQLPEPVREISMLVTE